MATEAGPLRLDLDGHASFLTVALANKISASASRAYTRQFGIGVMEWRVIGMLAVKPGATANAIGQISGVDKSSVSRATGGLIRRGLVEATEDSADNRRSHLNLTRSGMALHDRMIVSSLAREALLLEGFSASERQALFRFLKRLTGNMALVNAHDPGTDVPA